ncbi:MAG: hypothetical protein LBU55_06070 [Elusimicrobiota bacterium]|jgi:hypothetical protein|nr:hypothetical protein [Elusimicrobiota bacterium]
MLKSNKGQTLYYFLIFSLIVLISWAMMLNIAKVIITRMRMQIEADNIVLSVAIYKARVLNFLGETNYLIGVLLSLSLNPDGTQIPSFSTEVIGGYPAEMDVLNENPTSDFIHKTSSGNSTSGVLKIQSAVNALQSLQSAAVNEFFSYYWAVQNNYYNDKGYEIVLSPQTPLANLGLKRNSKGVNYYSTQNKCVYMSSNIHFHTVSKNKIGQDAFSWFVESPDFSRQKIKITLRQKSNYKPLFAKIFNIKFPQITVYSAASPYNVSGSMFPQKEDAWTGATARTKELVEQSALRQLELLKNAAVNAETLGISKEVLSQINEIISVNSDAIASANKNLSQDNPIDAYLDARDGGWSAHLVPYKPESE